MDISMWTSYLMELSPEDMILKFAEHGWKKLELSTEHSEALVSRGDPLKTGEKFGVYARENGIDLQQGHLWLQSDITNPEHQEILKKWLDLFKGIGIQKAVAHPGGWYHRENGKDEETVFNHQIKALQILVEHIGNEGITICIENMAKYENNAESIVKLIESAGCGHLAICLDTGHLNQTENKDQGHFIKTAGDYLKALHITDNEGTWDQHLVPFARGTIEWPLTMKALAENGYTGTINFEVPGDSINCPMEIRLNKLDYIMNVGIYLASLMNP